MAKRVCSQKPSELCDGLGTFRTGFSFLKARIVITG